LEKIKVLFIFGTRPEVIKMAPIIRAMSQRKEHFDVRICVTAQHRQMLDELILLFDIEPDYDLDLMEKDQSLSHLTARVIKELDEVLCIEDPNWVLVQGDTTTAMAAAITSYYNKIKIGHVEAGLRSKDKYHPFPEEINRRMISDIADVHFAPTETAKQELMREGVNENLIYITGNTVIDSLIHVKENTRSDIIESILHETTLLSRQIILVTAHRRENFGEPLQNVCEALKTLAYKYRDRIQIVYPVHPNPNVREPVHGLLGDVENIILTEPLDYRSFVSLLKNCYLVLTDSGGLQEEAPSLGKPVLVLRDVTERPEGITAGTAKLVGTDTIRIVDNVSELITNFSAYNKMAKAVNPYGDGQAANRICETLLNIEQKVACVC
jgi:UDP-N-acetylglucosamine 2-epimerase (non-hydrolysing)